MTNSYLKKYLKYKLKYLQLKGGIGKNNSDELTTELPTESHIEAIISNIKNIKLRNEINFLNSTTDLTFNNYKKSIDEYIYKDINDDFLLNFIDLIPKVELHIHLEGVINDTLIQKFNNPQNILILDSDEAFDKFNNNVEILCCDFKNNMEILLNYVYEDRYKQNIYYTQFHLSSLKIYDLTKLVVKQQFDIIIDIIYDIKKTNTKYNNIIIQFILDIPRGNADTYDYFENYFNDIIYLSKHDKYKNFIIAVGIGGRYEDKTIDNTYKKYFKKIKDQTTLKIIPHAGEFGTNTESCNSIKSALNYSKRIGHGVRIIECNQSDTILLDKSNIVLDINISSNLKFIDKYDNDLNKHPIKKLLEEGYNITLSTDDPGILYSKDKENINLLHEYKLLLEIIKNYSLKDKIDTLFNISINSIFFCYYYKNNYANKLLLENLKYYIYLYKYIFNNNLQ
jgi:adenosine deaminase